MQKEALSSEKTIVSYDANGSFLQQTTILLNNNTLSPLPTHDAVIVPMAIILLAQQQKLTISQLLTTTSQRYTFNDRVTFATEEVVRIRPPGNALELRCYTESDTAIKAEQINQQSIEIIQEWR